MYRKVQGSIGKFRKTWKIRGSSKKDCGGLEILKVKDYLRIFRED
jgi:hypothetical protein